MFRGVSTSSSPRPSEADTKPSGAPSKLSESQPDLPTVALRLFASEYKLTKASGRVVGSEFVGFRVWVLIVLNVYRHCGFARWWCTGFLHFRGRVRCLRVWGETASAAWLLTSRLQAESYRVLAPARSQSPFGRTTSSQICCKN